jgi:hypothetical protein
MKIKEFVNMLMNYDQDCEIVFESFDTIRNEYSETEINEIVLKVKEKVVGIRL